MRWTTAFELPSQAVDATQALNLAAFCNLTVPVGPLTI